MFDYKQRSNTKEYEDNYDRIFNLTQCRRCKNDVDKYEIMFGYCKPCQGEIKEKLC